MLKTSTDSPTLPLVHQLVNILTINPRFLIDIRYATPNNFMNQKLYSHAVCYLHEEAAAALNKVQESLHSYNLGLKIYDGYRPLPIQQLMWDAIQDERYVSNPAKNKGRHTRGTAVDVTLVDEEGKELEMPSTFDEFTERSHFNYQGGSEKALRNREFLAEAMLKGGFSHLNSEWWHYDFIGWNNDERFPALAISLDELHKQEA